MKAKFIFTLLISFVSKFLSAQAWYTLTNVNTYTELKCLQIISKDTIYAAGGNGNFIRTDDAGQNWSVVQTGLNTGITIRGIHFVNSMIGYAVGDSSKIIKTTNGGLSWSAPQSLNNSAIRQLYGVYCLNKDTVFATGANGFLFKTSNGGSSQWAQQPNMGANLWDVKFTSNLKGWIVGSTKSGASGTLLKTTNASTWTLMNNTQAPNSRDFYAIDFIDSLYGWIAGQSGLILRTKDAGNTIWTSQSSGTLNDLLDIDFIDSLHGYACGRQGTILHYNGTIWSGQYTGNTKNIWAIEFLNDSIGYAVGDSGLIMRFSKVVQNKPIVLLKPNGGEVFQIKDPENIIWSAPGILTIKIEYRQQATGPWMNIANNINAAQGSYAWTVPNSPCKQCEVRISNSSNPAVGDTSDAEFVILNQPDGRDYSVRLKANANGNGINLSWENDINATQYTLDRKLVNDSVWSFKTMLNGSVNSWLDNSASNGSAYEYRLTKTTPLLTGYGYIYAGINVPAIDNSGIALVLVDSTFSNYLSKELLRLKYDLVAEGYTVVMQNFAPEAKDTSIKNFIKQQYSQSNGKVKSVIIIGHLAIPYSGNFAPDGHAERVGAQPADSYYTDMDGNWTDNITVINSGNIYTPNLPNDGKWDQSAMPSDAELELGRIDMNNLSGFDQSIKDLLKRYLDKNHAYRSGIYSIPTRGLMFTNSDQQLPNISAGAWRSLSSSLGSSSIDHIATCYACTAFPDSLKANTYLMTYGGGGGTDTSFGGNQFTSSNCIEDSLRTIFMQIWGSYNVEWNKGGNGLPNGLWRSTIANKGLCLATTWSAKFPFWYFHHMGLGETIGYSVRKTINNSTTYDLGSPLLAKSVYMEIMGDPTLKLFVAKPATNLKITSNSNNNLIAWSASLDTNIVGYNLYRAISVNGNFAKLNTIPITSLSYTDTQTLSGNNVYLLRAIKLETCNSGTFFNLSPGILDSVINSVQQLNCVVPSTGFTPINDLEAQTFKNAWGVTWDGGLYPNKSNTMPPAHKAAGMNMASEIQCLDTNGLPDAAKGKIAWLSIGLSNTTLETQQFIPIANALASKNPKLVLVDGAVGSMSASVISTPTNPNYSSYWNTVANRLKNAGINANQVQVIWLKEANPAANMPIQQYYDSLVPQMKRILNEIKLRFPNVKLCYIASRISARYAISGLNPEPYSYYTGWAVKKVIEDQINGDAQLTYSGANAKAPWLSWGIYMWSDGNTAQQTNPAIFWTCPDDFNPSDGTHPSLIGSQKVANLLLNFFSNDSTTKPWFINAGCSIPGAVDEKDFQSLKIYPNPSNGSFTLQLPASSFGKISFSIFNTLGEEVENKEFSSAPQQTKHQLHFNNLTTGIYLVKIELGGKLFYQRVLIEK